MSTLTNSPHPGQEGNEFEAAGRRSTDALLEGVSADEARLERRRMDQIMQSKPDPHLPPGHRPGISRPTATERMLAADAGKCAPPVYASIEEVPKSIDTLMQEDNAAALDQAFAQGCINIGGVRYAGDTQPAAESDIALSRRVLRSLAHSNDDTVALRAVELLLEIRYE